MNTTSPSTNEIAGLEFPNVEPSSGQDSSNERTETHMTGCDPIANTEPLGIRMRAAREAKGLSCEDVAHQLRLPHTVIEALEAEHFEDIGYGIYLRGYLNKYLTLLNLPQSLASDVLDGHSGPPPLVTSRALSRPRYLFERYSGSALYLILTGVIVVPSIMLAMHAGGKHGISAIAPLDKPLGNLTTGKVAIPQTTTHRAGTELAAGKQAPTAAAPVPKQDQAPLAASMAPFNATTQKPQATPPQLQQAAAKPPVPAPVSSDGHDLHLQLVQPSWVEVVDGAGEQLEYSLLPAGAVRDYKSDKSLHVLLGNAAGASVMIDGKPYDLAPYLRGNVARFDLAKGDWSISPSGG